MEPTELRIGNFVMVKGEESGIRDHFTVTDPNQAKFFNPIPLTKEWLLKFGFEYNSHEENYNISSGDGYYHSIRYLESVYKNDGWYYNNDESSAECYTIMRVEFIHQLQNLYFALTGKELTIKTK